MKTLLSLICITFLLSSCVSSRQFVPSALDDEVNENFAKIYIFRTKNYATSIPVRVFQENKLIGILGPKSFLAWSVDPSDGNVVIVSKTENKDDIVINPEAGKTYYIRQKMKMGVLIARTKLELLNEIEGEEVIGFLKKAKYKERKQKANSILVKDEEIINY